MNIVVIGGGPAGYPAALKAAALGAKVTLVEKNKIGGVCLNCGCIPSKSMLEAAHRFQGLRGIGSLCKDGTTGIEDIFAQRDWDKIKLRQQTATRKLSQGISFLLKKAGIEVVEGEASFVDEHTLAVSSPSGTRTLSCEGVILATGSEAFFPPPFDKYREEIYDNSTIFTLPQLPESLTIVGGGVIGCEMADLFNALGVMVSVVELQPRILPLEDETASRVLFQSLSKRGVKFYLGQQATQVYKNEAGFQIELSNGEKVASQKIMAAIGRSVDLSALKMENVGIEWSRKGVAVNPETLQLKNNIYAAGDVTGLLQLAHAATRQGEVAACNLCGVAAVYHNESVPKVVYTQPEIASVGLTRSQAEQHGIELKSYKSFFLANGRAVAQEQTEGFVEWFSDPQTGKLLGASLVGGMASELVHIPAIALAAEMNVEQLKEVIFAHPTFGESLGEAVAR